MATIYQHDALYTQCLSNIVCVRGVNGYKCVAMSLFVLSLGEPACMAKSPVAADYHIANSVSVSEGQHTT